MELTLTQKMVNELECRSCLRLLEIPSIQCLRGHHYCGKCIKDSSHCSECQAPLETSKSYLFEQLVFNTVLKCSFSAGGCNIAGTASVIADHEKGCPFHPSSSPITTTTNESKERTEEVNQQPEQEQKSVSRTESAGQSLAEVLLAELECPVCMARITPPINQCKNCHIICKKCFDRLDQCPICRGPKLLIRNVILERLFHVMEMPCNNADNGCMFRGKGFSIPDHEKSCEYVLKYCPLMGHVKCTWQGIYSKIIDHCRTTHSDVFSSGPEQTWDLEEFLSNRYRKCCVKLVYAYGLLFKNCWHKDGNDVIFHVYSLGDQQDIPQYLCDMGIGPLGCGNVQGTDIKQRINETVISDEHSIKYPLESLLKIREEGYNLIFMLDILDMYALRL